MFRIHNNKINNNDHDDAGCVQIQPNFQEISRTHLTKFQQDFYIERAPQLLQHGIQTHGLSVMCDIMNRTAQKMVK